jgi:hypothetical protein
MNIEELAKQLDALTPEQSLALFDSIVGLQERASKMREEKVAAERERDERYPVCGCGKPATDAAFFLLYTTEVEPGIMRRYRDDTLRGGIVFTGDSDVFDVPEQEDLKRIDRLMWVKCRECAGPWRAIENGFDLKVGQRY